MQRRKFSREFKIEAVRWVGERGVSVAQASRDIDVHEKVVRKWGEGIWRGSEAGVTDYGRRKSRKCRSILRTRKSRRFAELRGFEPRCSYRCAREQYRYVIRWASNPLPSGPVLSRKQHAPLG